MYPCSHEALQTFSSGLRRGQVVFSAWRGNQRLTSVPQDIVSGSLNFTGGTGVRAQGSMIVPRFPNAFETFVPGIVTVRVSWAVRFINESVEYIPLGRFDITKRAPVTEGVELSLRDYFGRVIDRGFDTVESPNGNALRVAASWVRQAVGADLTGLRLAGSTVAVSGQAYEGDRAAAVTAVLDAAGMEGYVDRLGRFVARPYPLLTGLSTETIRSGPRGVYREGERAESRESVVNRLNVRPDGTQTWFKPFTLDNTNRRSLTNIFDSPIVAKTVSNPRWRTETAARVGARAALDRLSALQATASVTALSNPAREPGDVVTVGLLEAENVEVTQRQLIESFSLSFDGADQALQLSSARPTADGDEVLS